MRSTTAFRFFILGALLSLTMGAHAMTNEEISEEFSALFTSYQVTMFNLQPLINDPNIGDKGLTGDVIVQKTKETYSTLHGRTFEFSDVPMLKKAQETLFASIASVIDKVQPAINREGLGFKGMIPAVFARKLATDFTHEMKGEMSFKFTAPHDVLRSRANKADDWEQDILTNKFRQASWTRNQTYSEVNDSGTYRWMKPIYHKEACMKCHGGPKGERDITGGMKEGAKVGDLSGAFSITIAR